MDVEWRRVAVYVVCRDPGARLLLTRFAAPGHPDSGKWTLPGGAMEWGESPEQTAHRELAEETGLEVTLGPVLGVFSRWLTGQESIRGQAGHVVGILYEGLELRGRLRTELPEGTTDDARWFDMDALHGLPRVELLDFALGLIA